MFGSTFSGRLYYDSSDDFIDIISFIIRDNDIGFTLASVTSEYGRWTVSGTAARDGDGAYVAKNLHAKQMNETCSSPWDLRFRVVSAGASLLVDGELTEMPFLPCRFDGELEAFNK